MSNICELHIDSEIRKWLLNLKKHIPQIREIWFYGSRANGTERPDSDWDFLVSGEGDLVQVLEKNIDLYNPNIDLLASVDGQFYKSVWGREKCINLYEIGWTIVNINKAEYWGIKKIARVLESPDIESPFDLSSLGNYIKRKSFSYKLNIG